MQNFTSSYIDLVCVIICVRIVPLIGICNNTRNKKSCMLLPNCLFLDSETKHYQGKHHIAFNDEGYDE